MSTVMAGPMIAQGQLQVLLAEWSTIPMPIHVVYPQNRHLSTKVRVFTEWAAELLRDHPRMRLPRAVRARAISCPVVSGARSLVDSLG